MKYLKIITIVSFLLIVGLDQKGFPNFITIFICASQFLINLLSQPFNEISWGLGLAALSAIACIFLILFSKHYKDRYILIFCFATLLCIEVYFSGILRYQNFISWFIYPLLIFVVSMIVLIVINFKPNKI